jgi:hypothetical protein
MVIFPMSFSSWSTSRLFSKPCKASIRAMRVNQPYLEVAIRQPIKSRFVKLDGTPYPDNSRSLHGTIGIEQFYNLAMEMVKADPMVAVQAFNAATRHALDAALHPPKPEPVSRLLSLKRKLAANATQTDRTVPA